MPTAGNDGYRGVYPEQRRRTPPILRVIRDAASCEKLAPVEIEPRSKEVLAPSDRPAMPRQIDGIAVGIMHSVFGPLA